MKVHTILLHHTFLLLVAGMPLLQSQVTDGVYIYDGMEGVKELKVQDGYLIQTIYETTPPGFVSTAGGFYKEADGIITVSLEFNSNYEQDSTRVWTLPVKLDGGQLILGKTPYGKQVRKDQPLDGNWLFAARGPDTGLERRDENSPRKTMKMLVDGKFQWIAFNIKTFRFSGTGGGSYTAGNGRYRENIAYFSRDNDRVGAMLNFEYELNGDDWHHSGKNSKGEPLYEIWSRRD